MFDVLEDFEILDILHRCRLGSLHLKNYCVILSYIFECIGI